MSPQVTVVIPTHDRPGLLDGALASVRGQSAPPVAVVVVDDGSADAAAVAAVAARHGAELIRHDEPRGVSVSRNEGIDAARTPWVALLDDDDLWAPDKLEREIAVLGDRRWVTAGCVAVTPELAVAGSVRMPASYPSLYELLLDACYIPAGCSSVLAEVALIQEAGGFPVGVHGCEDWDLWLRMARLAPVAYVDAPLVAYRVWPGNTSRDADLMAAGRAWALGRHGRTRVSRDLEIGWQQSQGLAYARAGNRTASATSFARAFREGGGAGQLAYGAAGLLAPRAVVRRLERQHAAVDPLWRDEAERWLKAL